MRLIDADALKEVIHSKSDGMDDLWDTAGVLNAISKSPTIAITDRPLVIINDKVAYITQGHIDALIEYEKREHVKELVDNIIHSFEYIQTI